MSDVDWDNLISFDDWMDDWWKTLSFWKKVRYVLMGVWLRYISWPLQDAGYTIWRWVGEKCDWLELVYWELMVEDDDTDDIESLVPA